MRAYAHIMREIKHYLMDYNGIMARHQPYHKEGGIWIFYPQNSGKTIKVAAPEIKMVNIEVTGHSMYYGNQSGDSGIKLVSDMLESAVRDLKKEFNITSDNWVGNLQVMEPYLDPSRDSFHLRVVGQMVDVDKKIFDVDFKSKLEDIVND